MLEREESGAKTLGIAADAASPRRGRSGGGDQLAHAHWVRGVVAAGKGHDEQLAHSVFSHLAEPTSAECFVRFPSESNTAEAEFSLNSFINRHTVARLT